MRIKETNDYQYLYRIYIESFPKLGNGYSNKTEDNMTRPKVKKRPMPIVRKMGTKYCKKKIKN